MINIDKLRGKIAEKRTSQAKLAEKIGVVPKTFYNKMNKGVFDSKEIEIIIEELEIDDPLEIFFAKEVSK